METVDDLACRDLVEVVTDYLDGVLPARERSRFERHIEGCDACRVYVEQLRQTIAAARATREETSTLEVPASLLAAFRGWKKDTPGT